MEGVWTLSWLDWRFRTSGGDGGASGLIMIDLLAIIAPPSTTFDRGERGERGDREFSLVDSDRTTRDELADKGTVSPNHCSSSSEGVLGTESVR